MNVRVLACFRAFSVATALVAQNPAPATKSGWKTFSCPADGFSVLLPSEPNLSKNDVPIGDSRVEMHSYIVLMDLGALFVGTADFNGTSSASDPASLLQSVKSFALKNAHAQVLNEKTMVLNDQVGLEFEAASERMHYFARFYVVGTRVYQTLVELRPGVDYPDKARFLDSFEVIPLVSQ